ncbi:hypothetical protein [Sphingosinicella sp. CPCC 101087]|uniref:hypothetical protein n=1 Tax=Sphingosinicella sp. CPCC 101087 TaxID=2497754 RepID=UPI00101D36AF|nr:hypothetical protein [Sphingosinicella sp. CPCC 101087]
MAKSINDLSKLVSAGRARKGVPATRSEVLAALLRKRAAAWRSGLSDLEARLRNQILWSLPVERPEDSRTANEADDVKGSGATPGD